MFCAWFKQSLVFSNFYSQTKYYITSNKGYHNQLSGVKVVVVFNSNNELEVAIPFSFILVWILQDLISSRNSWKWVPSGLFDLCTLWHCWGTAHILLLHHQAIAHAHLTGVWPGVGDSDTILHHYMNLLYHQQLSVCNLVLDLLNFSLSNELLEIFVVLYICFA